MHFEAGKGIVSTAMHCMNQNASIVNALNETNKLLSFIATQLFIANGGDLNYGPANGKEIQ